MRYYATRIVKPIEVPREDPMRTRRLLLVSTASFPAILLQASPQAIAAQGQAALTGQITSEAEGAMEGVVVSARKAGSTVEVSVITDAQGRYSFPADRLAAGSYGIKIRAVGYD